MLKEDGTIVPDEDEPTLIAVREFREWLDEQEPHSWPSTAQLMNEIAQETDKAHGGPLETPTVETPKLATWDKIRSRLAKTAAAATA
jgi:hypothetical protein